MAQVPESDLDACRHACAAIGTIATNPTAAGDRNIVRSWRVGLHNLTHKLSVEINECRAIVDLVETIVSGADVEQDVAIQASRTSVWTALAHCYHSEQSDRRWRPAEIVDRIASMPHFQREPGVQRNLAEVWHAMLQWGDRSERQRFIAQVERITGSPPAAVDPDMQWIRTTAWGKIAIMSDDPVEIREVAERIEAIADRIPFFENSDIQVMRCTGWGRLAEVSQGDRMLCRRLAEQIQDIACAPAFLSNPEMLTQRAQAWCHVAAAERDDEPACREAVARVEAIAALPAVSDLANIQAPFSEALCNLAHATRHDPVALHAVIDRIATLAERPALSHFPEIRQGLERARRFAA